MRTGLKSLDNFSYWLSAVTLFVILLAFHSITNAGQPDLAQSRIVALGFDNVTQTLLKATSKVLYRSSDEGRTWTHVALPRTAANGDIAALAISAHHKDVFYIAGPGLGVLRSENGGRSWVTRNQGLPGSKVEALTAHADEPDTLYAYLAGKGIFRSQDAGKHWRLMDSGPPDGILHFVHSNMPGSMQTGWLFAATFKGVRRSMDCFCGWHDAGGLAAEVQAIAYDPKQPQYVYAAARNEFFVSTNGGEQWTSRKPPAALITALVATSSGALYAAGDGLLFRSLDHGATWEKTDA
jgi:photosystem II stability/assembly factor-like uncharacterized protein